MNRIGLVQLSSSARNSPYGSEKLPFEKSNSANKKKNVPEPLKAAKKGYQPSPLSTSLIGNPKVTPVSSPFEVFCEEKEWKENVETQTEYETYSISTQTSITVPHTQPIITANDLTSDKPTINYLRVLADRLQLELEEEMETNARLVNELCDLDEKIGKTDNDMDILIEVLAEIEEDKTDEELGTSQL